MKVGVPASQTFRPRTPEFAIARTWRKLCERPSWQQPASTSASGALKRVWCRCIIASLILASTKTTAIKSILSRTKRGQRENKKKRSNKKRERKKEDEDEEEKGREVSRLIDHTKAHSAKIRVADSRQRWNFDCPADIYAVKKINMRKLVENEENFFKLKAPVLHLSNNFFNQKLN